MKMINWAKLIGFIVILGIIAARIHYTNIQTEKVIENLRLTYPLIRYDQAIDGHISFIHSNDDKMFRDDPNVVNLVVDDTLKLSITVMHPEHEQFNLENLLDIGVRIHKKKNQTELKVFVINNGDSDVHMFQLANELRYPMKAVEQQ